MQDKATAEKLIRRLQTAPGSVYSCKVGQLIMEEKVIVLDHPVLTIGIAVD